jgi:Peptidase A4 family
VARAFRVLSVVVLVLSAADTRVPVDGKAGPNIAIQGTTFSLNWAGNVAATNLEDPIPQVTQVAACWITPTIQKPPATADSVVFVGIGGFDSGDTTLIQAGTRHQINHGVVTYSAWYELLPAAIATTNVPVLPGDEVCVSIEQTNTNPEEWVITIDNRRTGGVEFTQEFPYASSNLTAEWIVERLSQCVVGPGGVRCHLVNLADFGSVTFTDANATINGVSTTLVDAPDFDDVIMVNGAKALAAVTDQVDGTNEGAFTVTYKP